MIGQVVGQYRIMAKLGEGAIGEVYKAEHILLRHHVALKFLKPGLVRNDQIRLRFLHEAEIAASFDHPGICNVIDFGEEGDRTFLVMRFCHGQSLKEKLEDGPLTLAQTILYAIQVAEGLEAAHLHGVIHRDIKPSNVIVSAANCPNQRITDQDATTLEVRAAARMGSSASLREQARIIDFGLALLPELHRLTGEGVQVGTPFYMSPEQVRGNEVDARTDLWSLGVMIYEMVSGQLPFKGDSTAAVFDAIERRDPPPLHKVGRSIPSRLTWIVSRSLSKNPDDRYADASEMLGDLRALYTDLRAGRRRELPTWALMIRRRALGLAAVCLLVLLISLGIWRTTTQHSGTSLPKGRSTPITSGTAWEGDPTISPDGRTIAYNSNEAGSYDIYVVDAGSGLPLRLTEDPACDRSPAWFPDGRNLAFVSDRLGRDGIWKTGQHGGGATLLLDNAWDPAIDETGHRLAFVRHDSRQEGRIGILDLDQHAEPRLLTRGPADGLWDHREPTWSHDGRWICYSAKNNLWLLDLDSEETQPLTQDGREDQSPVWSPDDQWVYFSSLRDNVRSLWRVHVADGQLERVTLGGGSESHPSLSADGHRLTYFTQSDMRMDLVIVDRVSGHEHRLSGQHNDSQPALARDRSAMVFVSDRWGDRREIWWQDLENSMPHGPPRRLTEQAGHASHPAISPDGRWVAYYRFQAEERDLWIVPSEGGQPHRVTDHPGSDVQPSWSPDGTQLAFSSDRDSVFAIWVLPVAEGRRAGEPRRLTAPSLVAYRPVWSPRGDQIAFRANDEIWIIPADGSREPVALTSGAQAERLRWAENTDEIWISGRWGHGCFSLRTLPAAGGEPEEISPEYCFDRLTQVLFFDVDADGRLLVMTEVKQLSRVWMLEAEGGMF